MLANHPQDCLGCVKNTKCELQLLAARFGIRASPFHREAVKHESCQEIHTRQKNHTLRVASPQREIAGRTLVRDMDKCVKCGRCVETCQGIHTIRAINTSHRSVNYEINTPYGQALENGPCVFCGQCAKVCPVGAIYPHDQSAEVLAMLDSGKQMVAQLSPSTASALSAELNLPPESITVGKITTALKLIGFSHVYDACIFRYTVDREQISELTLRYKNSYRLPMISCCSQSAVKFIKEFYPDLVDRLYVGKSPHQVFAAFAKEKNPEGVGVSKIIYVSITSCIAAKFEIQQSWLSCLLVNAFDKDQNVDFALTTGELARMILTAGIDINNLAESPFDTPTDVFTKNNNAPGILTVNGLANARIIMDSIRMGKCDASLVRIMCCHNGCPDDDRVFNEVLKK